MKNSSKNNYSGKNNKQNKKNFTPYGTPVDLDYNNELN